MQTVTVIGAGNMGGALVRGFFRTTAEAPLRIIATAHGEATLQRLAAECPGVETTTDNAAAAAAADVVIIAVKPWLVDSVVGEIRQAAAGKLVCSVAAGVSAQHIAEVFAAGAEAADGAGVPAAVFCAMPNIAAQYGQSMTFIEENGAAGADGCPSAAAEGLETLRTLFSRVGDVFVGSAKQLEAGMMVSGCGVAYVMRFLRAMALGGVELGFRPADAERIAEQTMLGAVSILQGSGEHPEAAIDRVTTPGGYTIRGLNALDAAGFNAAVVSALRAGFER